MTKRITKGELRYVKYCMRGILSEIQSDSVDPGYIEEKLLAIKNTANRIRAAQETQKGNRLRA